MFKLHDSIVASPECAVSDTSNTPNRGEVIYIHPDGRYYVLEFKFPIGTIRETRRFSDGELIAAMNAAFSGTMHSTRPASARCRAPSAKTVLPATMNSPP